MNDILRYPVIRILMMLIIFKMGTPFIGMIFDETSQMHTEYGNGLFVTVFDALLTLSALGIIVYPAIVISPKEEDLK